MHRSLLKTEVSSHTGYKYICIWLLKTMLSYRSQNKLPKKKKNCSLKQSCSQDCENTSIRSSVTFDHLTEYGQTREATLYSFLLFLSKALLDFLGFQRWVQKYRSKLTSFQMLFFLPLDNSVPDLSHLWMNKSSDREKRKGWITMKLLHGSHITILGLKITEMSMFAPALLR